MINETLWHDERQVARARTGASSFTFPDGNGDIIHGPDLGSGVFPVAGTIPMARILAGTIQTTGAHVLGDVDVNFEAAGVKVSDYLYNGGVGGIHAVRKITEVSANRLELEAGFPTDLVDVSPQVCERQMFKLIVIDNTHDTADAIIQEAPFAPGKNFVGGGSPVAYDATGSQLDITVHK